MIDIHSHILPGVDDGARNFQVAMEMAYKAKDDGIKAIVATPHFDPEKDNIEKYLTERNKSMFSLEKELIEKNIELDVKVSAEIKLTYELHKQPYLHRLAMDGGYLLLEIPFGGLHDWMKTEFYRLRVAGFKPILAHPERIEGIGNKLELLKEYVEQGLYLQLTADSLTGCFFNHETRIGKRLLKNDLVHFVATDAHDAQVRKPVLSEAFLKLKKFGLVEGFRSNAEAVWQGAIILD